MIQPLLIALVAVVYIHDANPAMLAGLRARFSPADAAGATLGACAGLAITAILLISTHARALGRPHAMRRVARAEMVMSVTRFLATFAIVASVLAVGWLDAVRGAVGDLILVDEVLTILPALAVFVAGWWAFYPIERRLHDALIIRTLDEGRPVYPAPTRAQFVLDRVRHQLLLLLLPVGLLMAWSEGVVRWMPDLLERFGVRAGPDAQQAIAAALQLVGAGVVFVFAPPLLRLVWSTTRLAPGPLRDRLESLCAAHRVRVRDMLVWRTHGLMINGAVIGLVGRLRYILLTDALLDALPTQQVEAVMAHEVAHIRRRHLPWLVGAMLGCVGVSLLLVLAPAAFFARVAGLEPTADAADLLSAASSIVSLACALVVFGFVSRRFERQADAFAAQHLSGMTRANAGSGVRITPEAAEAMAGALQAVAELNHIPVGRFAWRHGSIAGRQRAVRALVGAPADRIPIDRTVRSMKLLTILALALTLVGVFAESALLAPPAARSPDAAALPHQPLE